MVTEGENKLRIDIKWPENAMFQTKKYRDARVEAHNALFWMARASHSFLEPTLNNSHLSLFWNEDNFGPIILPKKGSDRSAPT